MSCFNTIYYVLLIQNGTYNLEIAYLCRVRSFRIDLICIFYVTVLRSYYEKSIISGHYIFSSSDFLKIKEELNYIFEKKKINLDNELKKSIKKSILRYLNCFELIK